MSKVRISSKYQLVIPKNIRESANLMAGSMFELLTYGNHIELIPVDSIKKLKSFLKGMDTTILREDDRL
jgi:AbrB family looped-hinge helix DNA binding protein